MKKKTKVAILASVASVLLVWVALLCHILTEGDHVSPTIHMSITEQVFIFLHIIGHNVRFCVMSSRISRSTETVYRYFKVVLRGGLEII